MFITYKTEVKYYKYINQYICFGYLYIKDILINKHVK